jgi:hypothetical protein
MEFEWDENKNKFNELKHGIGFEEATKIFDDEKRVEYQDLRKDYVKTVGRLLGRYLVSFFQSPSRFERRR